MENHLVLRIPTLITEQLHLHPDSTVNIEVKHDLTSIQPFKYSLEDMLREITLHNQHHLHFEDGQENEW